MRGNGYFASCCEESEADGEATATKSIQKMVRGNLRRRRTAGKYSRLYSRRKELPKDTASAAQRPTFVRRRGTTSVAFCLTLKDHNSSTA
ncbi:hypothetical protein IG631_03625 [Alternaria alternata]|nr:hypothetical protein IG631_03625 [Alternaria alternata]